MIINSNSQTEKMENQGQSTCNADERVVPTYKEHTPQKRPHDGSDDGSDGPKRPRYDDSDDGTPQKRPRYDDSDDGSGDDSDDGSGDDSDYDSDSDPVEDLKEGRTAITEECRNIIEILEDYSRNPEDPKDPEDPGDLRKKKELSNALLEATSVVVDTYTKLIEVYDDKTFTMEKFDELLSLRRSQDYWFLSRKNAILNFVGYKCQC